ncbi:MAG: RIP metalloprotease RseP [Pseudonocardiales bacterium]|nr:RIP metalloprotease RseP [Pseudonocardiales bacterium]
MTITTDAPPDQAPDAWPHQPQPEGAQWISGGAGSGETPYVWARLAAMVAVFGIAVYFFGAYALLMILALIVSIVLHEFGHYWTAKRSGMKVTEFFVGFGPRIWSFHRGETEYGIKAIPAGAYVRIIGMNNLEEIDPADEARSYRAQSAPKRVAVVLAGPFMNIMIALSLMFMVFLFQGQANGEWTVKGVQDGTAAATAGVQAGDRILSVDGDKVESWDHFRDQLNAKAGEQVTLVVDRAGQQVTLTPTLKWRLSDEGAAAIPSTPVLKKADAIISANGQPVATFADLKAMLEAPGAPVNLQIDRNSNTYQLIVDRPVTNLPAADKGSGGFLGVQEDPVLQRESPIGAIGEAFGSMKDVVVGTGAAFGHLFTPAGLSNYAGQVVDSTQATTTIPVTNEAGVLTPVGSSPAPDAAGAATDAARPISIVGIVHVGSQAAELGLWAFLMLVATVNFALAMINLLPVLPFDGGHAAIATYEGIRGSIRHEPYRADLTKMLPIVYGVFAVLVLLGTTSILLDVLRPPSIK